MEHFHATPSSRLCLADRLNATSYLRPGPTGQVHSGWVLELVHPGLVLDSTSCTSRFKATGRFTTSAILLLLSENELGEQRIQQHLQRPRWTCVKASLDRCCQFLNTWRKGTCQRSPTPWETEASNNPSVPSLAACP